MAIKTVNRALVEVDPQGKDDSIYRTMKAIIDDGKVVAITVCGVDMSKWIVDKVSDNALAFAEFFKEIQTAILQTRPQEVVEVAVGMGTENLEGK